MVPRGRVGFPLGIYHTELQLELSDGFIMVHQRASLEWMDRLQTAARRLYLVLYNL